MKIALAQFNPTVGDFSGNSARILSLSEQAQQRGATLAVFSELCLCGYPPQDLLERPAFIERNVKELKELAKKMALPAIVGYAGRVKSKRTRAIANKAALVCGGRVVFEQSKMLLPTYDVFDESRYFQPAEKQSTYDFGTEHLGITICEDVWNEKNFWPESRYDRDPVTELVVQGTSLLLNISASPYTIDKRALRFDMLRSIAKSHHRPVIYVNPVSYTHLKIREQQHVELVRVQHHLHAGVVDDHFLVFDLGKLRGHVAATLQKQACLLYTSRCV